MDPNETKVALSYKVAGAQLTYGKYDYQEKSPNTGNFLPMRKRFRILKESTCDDCIKRVTLGTSFIKHALKTRPHPRDNMHAYKHWGKWSDEEKLEYHIVQFVRDMDAFDYEYEIF